MSPNQGKSEQSEVDIFIANRIFPDATSLFANVLKPVEDIKDNAIIVLDTNTLLVPYTTGTNSLNQIQKIYRELVQNNRLIIPAQAAREFVKNRPTKIAEVYQQLTRKNSSQHKFDIGKYPLLESLEAYKETLEIEKEINELIKKYTKAISSVIDHISGWTWNDPVSLIYAEIFNKSVIIEPEIDQNKVKEDLKNLILHKNPPGYKDGGKPDLGIGDLLIWLTILEIGKSNKSHVIFVSGEEKHDWFYRSEKKALYPRYELVDEFRRETEGCSFHIISFSRLLDLYGADEDVVEEIRMEENRLFNSATHHPQERDYWYEEIELETIDGQKVTQETYLLRVYPEKFNGYDAYMDIPMSCNLHIIKVFSPRLNKTWKVVFGPVESPITGIFRGDYTSNNPPAWIFGLSLLTE
ncbi:DUF4935 domain-containing protein [Anabaena cylindrica FACHB-243]|uniref:PIN like domain-containing protein n=1 Tax=Anabaena cylindrica (strain ATCC 27899 / PCC 7122) TaxID=272123 RepID=K9ZGH6_ANACC|nr:MULTISPECIES: PIN domain-containing protein [Anabaena]AFZ57672.1 hypothetical protein Anacy_2211 [Anabaena cylindrica PCC 7122]MBD2421205.1 DUF4935 domain-containing protein [Anabaena cylindrica FACHB-243]MBY5283126.1 DUF4935 domain-containing protein [Anabaena sp. CCAP 1446/1C]MBY5308260.1 DUF4935 domain-containing protein [Anabaena sp. CCAP 1446/1C]MCM2410250.1 PIN domain-containing protein [Anabaena sp. CCAP 1446/1C]